MCSWYNHNGPQEDIVLSSRVRLARNANNHLFTNRLSNQQSKKLIEQVKDTVLNGSLYLKEQFNYININESNQNDVFTLLEKHLISKELINKKNIECGALISKDETISILINEEDHIRIQSTLPGFQLKEAFDLSDKVDSLFEEKIHYAFDEKLGYLTSCPTNVGTGMRASAMLHLPSLSMVGYINGLVSALSKIGITVRGLYGEGSQALGNIYQISNQITLGNSEEDILENLEGVILQIIDKERKARKDIFEENKIEFTDRIYRAYGILSNARLLDSKECISLLSDIRLGVNLGILEDIDLAQLSELLINIRLAHALDNKEENVKRAEYVREKLMKKER